MKVRLAIVLFLFSTWATASDAPHKLTDADLKLLTDLSQGDVSEVETGEFVRKRAGSKSVKDFAGRMVADHSKLSQELKSWASKNSVSLPETPNTSSDEGRGLLKDLAKLSGKDFDTHYIEAMLSDHRKDVSDLQKFIAAHPDSVLKPIVSHTQPIIENHLRVAENVAGALGLPADKGLNQPEHP